jgi:hypothetical protein
MGDPNMMGMPNQFGAPFGMPSGGGYGMPMDPSMGFMQPGF